MTPSEISTTITNGTAKKTASQTKPGSRKRAQNPFVMP